jgi:hypothetical protein
MEKAMGQVKAGFRLWNMLDEWAVLKGEKKPFEEECLVDTGAVMAVIPEKLARELNLLKSPNKILVTFADGLSEYREVAIGLRLETFGRDTECRAIIEPGRSTILIGQIVLEEMDLLVDGEEQKLFPPNSSVATSEILAA